MSVREVGERGRAVLDTICTVKGVKVIDGEATVKVDSSVRRAAKAAIQASA